MSLKLMIQTFCCLLNKGLINILQADDSNLNDQNGQDRFYKLS